MEEKELVHGKLGEAGDYDLTLTKEGNLCVVLKAAVGPMKAGVTLELDSAEVLDVIAKAIPGTLDDAILGAAKAALTGK